MRILSIWAVALPTLLDVKGMGMNPIMAGRMVVVVNISEASSELVEMAAAVVEEEMAVGAEVEAATVAEEEEEGVAECYCYLNFYISFR